MLALLLLVSLFDLHVTADDDRLQDAVLYLCGAEDLSSVPEDDFARFAALASHPLRINCASRGALVSSGLFSAYQVESLLDYISRNGPVLSSGELAMVDGFSREIVHHLSLFLSFDDAATHSGTRHEENMSAGASLKINNGKAALNYMGKVTGDVQSPVGNFAAGAAYRNGNIPGASFSYSGHRLVRNITAGFFNARFAQGLSQWSGVSFDSWTTAASLMKRASGITPYRGWSTQYPMLGLAATLDFSNIALSPFADIRGGKYGLNLSWSHSDGLVGTTVCCTGEADISIGADFQHTLRGGVVIFGEGLATFNPVVRSSFDYAVLSGVRFRSGASDMALRLQGRPDAIALSFATGIADAAMRRNLSMALDAAFYPRSHGHTPKGASRTRLSITYAHNTAGGFVAESHLGMKIQALTPLSDPSAPYASSWPMMRFEARQKAGWRREKWDAILRADAVLSGKIQGAGQGLDLSFMAAAEGAWKGRAVRCHAQAAIFRIDSWESRIYLYQRDAPGMFSVPAMYGRGISLSGYAKMKLGRKTELHLKCAWSTYPWARENDTRKRDSLEANIQISYCLSGAR